MGKIKQGCTLHVYACVGVRRNVQILSVYSLLCTCSSAMLVCLNTVVSVINIKKFSYNHLNNLNIQGQVQNLSELKVFNH